MQFGHVFNEFKVRISSTKSPEKWQNPQKSGKIPGKVAEKKPLFKPRKNCLRGQKEIYLREREQEQVSLALFGFFWIDFFDRTVPFRDIAPRIKYYTRKTYK